MQLVAQRQCKAFCSAYTEAGGEQTLNIAAYSGVDDQSMWMPPQVTRICMSAFAHWLILDLGGLYRQRFHWRRRLCNQ